MMQHEHEHSQVDLTVNAGGKTRTLLMDRASDLIRALSEQVHPGVGLWDPLVRQPTPNDHYGQLAAALALRNAPPNPHPQWREPLLAWMDTDPRRLGHEPFNRLLLLLLRSSVSQQEAQELQLGEALKRCPLARRYPSNNWSLLARTCEVLEAPPGPAARRAVDQLVSLAEKWMTRDGGFIDFPDGRQSSHQFSTPTAYHHKALFVCTVAWWHSRSPALAAAVYKLLAWVPIAWDGGAHVGGWGRSNHALFGDACLLAALTLLDIIRADEKPNDWDALVRPLLARWVSQKRPDGLLNLTPGDAGSAVNARPPAWDDYMHLSVYNAWTAALLCWSLNAGKCPLPSSPPPVATPGTKDLIQDSDAGLLNIHSGGGLRALLSSYGQLPQGFSRDHVELRYAGGLPYHVTVNGIGPVCPPAVRVELDALLKTPALAGWTPVFLVQGTLFGLVQFDSVDIETTPDATTLQVRGHPVALVRPCPRTPWQRLLASLEWRIGIRPRSKPALRREVLESLTGQVTLQISNGTPLISQTVTLENRGQTAVRYLNPGGHAVISDSRVNRTFRVLDGGSSGVPSRAVTGFSSVTLPAALANATGIALPPTTLGRQIMRYQLTLRWPSDRLPQR